MSIGLSMFLTSLLWAMFAIAIVWLIPKAFKDIVETFRTFNELEDEDEEES